jgi:hypothetical protein
LLWFLGTQVTVSPAVIEELKRIIAESGVTKEDDEKVCVATSARHQCSPRLQAILRLHEPRLVPTPNLEHAARIHSYSFCCAGAFFVWVSVAVAGPGRRAKPRNQNRQR